MSKICGIYKITSPSKKVYIGQSVDIKNRWNAHRSLKCNRDTPILHNSIKKYGVEKHKFGIIARCNIEELNDLEKFYIDLYEATGKNGMNIGGGGQSAHSLSEETKEKIRVVRINESKQGQRTSRYIGVYKHSGYNKWVSRLMIGRRSLVTGTFIKEIDAAYYYDLAAISIKNEEKHLNFTEEQRVEISKTAEICASKIPTSKYMGVSKKKSKWIVKINGIYVGLFKDEISAAYAYDIGAINIYGNNCETNFTQKERDVLASNVSSRIIHKYKSKYKGVSSRGNRWRVYITVNRKFINLGERDTEEEAAQVYNDYVIKNKLNRELNVIK